MTRTSFGRAAAVVFAVAGLWGLASSASADAGGGSSNAEVALPPPPTAWYAAKPVGVAAGPVTSEQLFKGPADTSQWLHYGGDYRNFRNSPVRPA